MDDREVEKLIKSLDTEVTPPEGVKEKILLKVILENKKELVLTSFERFIFEKPLRFACVISVSVSGVLWMVLGSSFSKLLIGIMG
ncbi:hypothetical protein Cpap_2777 [Ruminiclostridium papyrosolvens DSM 2782]|uniref:Uncharacterized protein n=2 Tax=Ruminiclostridium papyrosolvens TaxID=29362 RepID=F1TBR8_9FIRM|nr:hypothetical protein [Ruminiclostridium papyrosolvens]EGD48089.1 hypothetical protein Cpap_2777 [Ruminiclostridium papyrosolvens DSM 2782]